ncbi:MAG: thioredoxin family protein [Candidatus Saliniplasma sp.]
MEIEIFGPGCRKCKRLEKNVKEVVKELSINADIKKVDDIAEMSEKGVMTTPAMAIDGDLKIEGKVPGKGAIKKIFEER